MAEEEELEEDDDDENVATESGRMLRNSFLQKYKCSILAAMEGVMRVAGSLLT